jgi:phosphotransferase system enzyme I (PtsI)
MPLQLTGNGVSNAVALGMAIVIPRDHIHVERFHLTENELEAEKARYQSAVEAAKRQLIEISSLIPENTSADINSFIDTHMLMLGDPTLYEAPVEIIDQELCNAEWALQQQHESLISVFEEIDDPYLKTRRDDIAHVVNRIQRVLMGETSLSDVVSNKDYSNQIIVIDDLSPAEIISIHQRGLVGFITEYGGPLSHSAILARSLGIPAIVGVHGARHLINSNETLVLDGEKHAVITSPCKRTQTWYRAKAREYKRRQNALASLRDEPAISRDKITIELQANIELPDDIRAARKAGCSGVGLLRTEYLYMNRDELPSEEEQFSAYRSIVRRMKGAAVTIRTLDLGADKQVDSGRTDMPMPSNPALGLRAIRLCLQDQALFHTQLRAILRASAYGPVRIMIPMISTVNEIRQVKTHIQSVTSALKRDRIAFDENIPLGAMIEIPAAAISARLFARYCDFMSIGTNDLIQYTLAIDRVDDAVNYLYEPMHPAILTLIKMTLDAGKKANIPVSMCGEMAGDTRFTRLLLGLGLTEFSMQASSLLEVKSIIRHTDIASLSKPVAKILHSNDSAVTYDLLHDINK